MGGAPPEGAESNPELGNMFCVCAGVGLALGAVLGRVAVVLPGTAKSESSSNVTHCCTRTAGAGASGAANEDAPCPNGAAVGWRRGAGAGGCCCWE